MRNVKDVKITGGNMEELIDKAILQMRCNNTSSQDFEYEGNVYSVHLKKDRDLRGFRFYDYERIELYKGNDLVKKII